MNLDSLAALAAAATQEGLDASVTEGKRRIDAGERWTGPGDELLQRCVAFRDAASPEVVLRLIAVAQAAIKLQEWGWAPNAHYGCNAHVPQPCDACNMDKAIAALEEEP